MTNAPLCLGCFRQQHPNQPYEAVGLDGPDRCPACGYHFWTLYRPLSLPESLAR